MKMEIRGSTLFLLLSFAVCFSAAHEHEEKTDEKKSKFRSMHLNMLNRHNRDQKEESDKRGEVRSPFARPRYHSKSKRSASPVDDMEDREVTRLMQYSKFLMGKRMDPWEKVLRRKMDRLGLGKRDIDRLRWLKMQRFGRSRGGMDRMNMLRLYGKREAPSFMLDDDDYYNQYRMYGAAYGNNDYSSGYYKRGGPIMDPGYSKWMMQGRISGGKRSFNRRIDLALGKRDADYDEYPTFLPDEEVAEALDKRANRPWSPMG